MGERPTRFVSGNCLDNGGKPNESVWTTGENFSDCLDNGGKLTSNHKFISCCI